ncbi:sialoadhesin-like isoform X2 [Labeo rohita]|uniref:Sialoadhesin-like isoform X2 n=1 Tax=Labeo rohita TaxID=84645 RepID=A0A498NWI2_LABRO|nr:sialoadhesin-like isoform X2 [Labeo rohita]
MLIKNLDLSHHGEKVYAWIDPENVGSRTYKFYDVTSTILVDASPQKPIISIYGGDRTGDTITVECSTLHTCPYSRPSITLYGIEGSNQIRDESIKDGLWKTTLTRNGVVKAERLTITCSITHYGDITVTATKDKIAECVHEKITIEPELADVTVSIAKEFTCSVYHSCQNKNPTITWNYKNMEVTEGRKTLSDLKWISYSNIVFLATKEDHGKKLICTATFSGAYLTAFVVLHVQLDVLDNFKGRTRLLGNPNEQNCTVEMDNVQTNDNGPFCFQVERENERYSFNNSCVFIIMRAPDKPVMSSLPENIEPGTRVTVKCSVSHTCSSHPPEITWNVPTAQKTTSHNHMGGGVWETVSDVTFIPTGYEEKDEIVCTATYWGGKTQENTALLSIRRQTTHVRCQETNLSPNFMCHPPKRTNTSMVTENKSFSKPRMPSPKSGKKLYTRIDPDNIAWENYETDDATATVLVDGVHLNISIEPELADVTEGVGQNFTCTIYHSCQKENPVITWNYENMQVSAWNKKHSDSDQLRIAFSNITFLGVKEDNG